jgi:hypothetical protein
MIENLKIVLITFAAEPVYIVLSFLSSSDVLTFKSSGKMLKFSGKSGTGIDTDPPDPDRQVLDAKPDTYQGK